MKLETMLQEEQKGCLLIDPSDLLYYTRWKDKER